MADQDELNEAKDWQTDKQTNHVRSQSRDLLNFT